SGTAVRPRADLDQPLRLQRGKRLTHRPACDAHLFDQRCFLRQLVSDILVRLHDPALDIVDYLVRTLHASAALYLRSGLGVHRFVFMIIITMIMVKDWAFPMRVFPAAG